MIDLDIIKKDPGRIKEELKKRGSGVSPDQLVKFDTERRRLQAEIDRLRSQQNAANDEVAKAKGGAKQAKIASLKELSDKVKKLEAEYATAEQEFRKLYLSLPNFAGEDVPVGKDESANQVINTIGTPKKFDFKPKEHFEIPAIKPHIDFERGAKVSGNRFWYLKGPLVHLEFALLRYTLDFYSRRGYEPMRPPSMVREMAMEGTGFFPTDANMIYQVSGETDDPSQPEVFLSGTAEVALAAYHADERLNPKDLPRKYLGFSPAYRREAGSYGKDTKGILRGHEFDKFELFAYAHPDKSWELHEEMLTHAEEFWQSLGIPYQVVLMCTGDLAAPNAKKEDIEAWLPGQKKYREVASNSHDTDFQARRLGIKADGRYVHTLNNTGCAIGRAIVAIVENYQGKAGNVEMPEVLHPYLPFTKITTET